MIDLILYYWVELAMGLAASAVSFGFRYLLKRQKVAETKYKAIADGVTALLRGRMIQVCGQHRDLGYCPVHTLENLDALYQEYKALGGNETIATLIDEMHSLPREKKKEAD